MFYYRWNEWLTFFFIYCFFGWVWESCYVSLKTKRWVNRGFLKMPLLPIYGFGAVIMLLLALPFPGNYALQYVLGVIGPTILEYITGWGMEKLFKMRYWDYSNQKFNVRGYICLSSSIVWGIFTLLLTYKLHPPIERFVLEVIPLNADYVFIAVVSVLFVIDTIQSAKAAFDMGKALEKLTEVRAQLDDIQVQINLLKMETSQLAAGKKDAALDKVYSATNTAASTAKNTVKSAMDSVRNTMDSAKNAMDSAKGTISSVKLPGDEAAQKLAALRAKFDELALTRENITKGMSLFQRKLIKGNPTAASDRFGNALRELKEKFR